MKRKIVVAVVDKKTGRAYMWADSLSELAKTGECADGATLMCLTWESYTRRHQGGN